MAATLAGIGSFGSLPRTSLPGASESMKETLAPALASGFCTEGCASSGIVSDASAGPPTPIRDIRPLAGPPCTASGPRWHLSIPHPTPVNVSAVSTFSTPGGRAAGLGAVDVAGGCTWPGCRRRRRVRGRMLRWEVVQK